jgi:hypothetical protein
VELILNHLYLQNKALVISSYVFFLLFTSSGVRLMWHTLVKAISSTPSRHNILGTCIKYLYIEVRHWRSLSANHLEVLIHGVLFGKYVSKGRFGKERK